MDRKPRQSKRTARYTIGIDEVGRGPIAGHVAVGAFVFLSFHRTTRRLFHGVKESKQLSEIQREKWFAVIQGAKKRGLVDYRVSFQSHKVIDQRGLSYAIDRALRMSLNGLAVNRGFDFRKKHGQLHVEVLLDGGLKAPAMYKHQKTIVRGDEKVTVIALASICAKVLRDRRMLKLAKKYPRYGFEAHKGYGTRKHYAAIGKYGMIDEHRRSFMK